MFCNSVEKEGGQKMRTLKQFTAVCMVFLLLWCSAAAAAAESDKPAESAGDSVTIDHPDRGITYEIYYPSDGVEVTETAVFGMPGYTFKSESEGCYITVYSSGMYTSDIQSRLDSYDNVTYGDRNGWFEYTSYAAEGNMIGTDNGEGISRLLAFKVGNYEESPAEHEEIDGYLQSDLVTYILSSYKTSADEGDSGESPQEEEAEEQPVIVDGVAHLDMADIVIPEGWTVVKEAASNIKLERDEKVPPRVEGDDPLTATMTIIASSKIHGTAAEMIETTNSNFGGDNEILSGNYNGNDWVYICPVEDQFYMFTDTSQGTFIEVDGMFFSMNEEIESFLSGITVK